MSGAVPLLQILTQRACAATTDAADTEQSVEAGRRALGRWWSNYPWYDASEDGIHGIRQNRSGLLSHPDRVLGEPARKRWRHLHRPPQGTHQ